MYFFIEKLLFSNPVPYPRLPTHTPVSHSHAPLPLFVSLSFYGYTFLSILPSSILSGLILYLSVCMRVRDKMQKMWRHFCEKGPKKVRQLETTWRLTDRYRERWAVSGERTQAMGRSGRAAVERLQKHSLSSNSCVRLPRRCLFSTVMLQLAREALNVIVMYIDSWIFIYCVHFIQLD